MAREGISPRWPAAATRAPATQVLPTSVCAIRVRSRIDDSGSVAVRIASGAHCSRHVANRSAVADGSEAAGGSTGAEESAEPMGITGSGRAAAPSGGSGLVGRVVVRVVPGWSAGLAAGLKRMAEYHLNLNPVPD